MRDEGLAKVLCRLVFTNVIHLKLLIIRLIVSLFIYLLSIYHGTSKAFRIHFFTGTFDLVGSWGVHRHPYCRGLRTWKISVLGELWEPLIRGPEHVVAYTGRLVVVNSTSETPWHDLRGPWGQAPTYHAKDLSSQDFAFLSWHSLSRVSRTLKGFWREIQKILVSVTQPYYMGV